MFKEAELQYYVLWGWMFKASLTFGWVWSEVCSVHGCFKRAAWLCFAASLLPPVVTCSIAKNPLWPKKHFPVNTMPPTAEKNCFHSFYYHFWINICKTFSEARNVFHFHHNVKPMGQAGAHRADHTKWKQIWKLENLLFCLWAIFI